MHTFTHLSIAFCLYMALQYQSCRSSNFLVFRTSSGISSNSAAFLFLLFVCTMLSSPLVNCLGLMSCWLLIFISLSVTLGNFPNRFLKCSFHMCILSFWLAAFSLVLEVLFLLLTSFTLCHSKQDCLSSTEFLILVVFSWCYLVILGHKDWEAFLHPLWVH